MRRRDFCLGALATPMLARSAFADEVLSITLIAQHGLPYLPLMVMEAQKLIEKHAAKLGLPSLKTDYRTLGGTQSLIDALIGGSRDFCLPGRAGLAAPWGKTRRAPEQGRGGWAPPGRPLLAPYHQTRGQSN